jgi:hypothetical protein
VPREFARQIPDPFSNEIFRQAGGVRLALETEASTLEFDLAAYRSIFAGLDIPVYPVIFDLVVDAGRHAAQTVSDVGTRSFDLDTNFVDEERRAITLRFERLPPGAKTVELWFPPAATVEICALRADGPVRPARERRRRWVHYGSSISHCYEAHSPTQTWPAVAAQLAGVDLLNLGVGGSCFLDQFVARAIRGTPAAFISLKVGINVVNADAMKLRTFSPAVHGFLDTVREGHPDTPILLVSPVICPPHEDAPGPTLARDENAPFVASARPLGAEAAKQALTLRRLRTIVEEVVRIRSEDDRNLHYLSGLTLFNQGDVGDLPDLLHPNGDGYLRIGERFAAAAFGPDGPFATRSL